MGPEVAQFEVEHARRLADVGCPTGTLEPPVDPVVYVDDGLAVTLWTYYGPVTPQTSPAHYADALERLHVGMRKLDVWSPSFTDRVAEAEELVASTDLTPALADPDRELLSSTLAGLRRAIGDRGVREQLLHGEPHPGNVLSTKDGLLSIDLETCCRGPVEFDLAHVPETASQHYPGVDQGLLSDCRQLVLAMVAAVGPRRPVFEREASQRRAPERATRRSSRADARSDGGCRWSAGSGRRRPAGSAR